MHGDPVGAGCSESLQVPLGLDDHQVKLQRQGGLATQHADGVHAECVVGDKDAVHDVDVQPLRPAALEAVHGISQASEVGRQQARRDPDRVVAGAPRRARHGVMMPESIATHRTQVAGVRVYIVS